MGYEHYIGIDLHKAFFQACAMTATGERCWETRFPRTPVGIAAFRSRCTAQTAVAIEASTPTWHFADALQDAVGVVSVIDPLKTRLKAGYAAKTDRLDARRLADALRRDSVQAIYYPVPAIRELRELCRYRHTLVRTKTALIQRVRAVLLRQGVVDARRLAKCRLTDLELFCSERRARGSVAGLRRLIEAVNGELQRANADVEAEAAQDAIVGALTTLRGIGAVLGLTIRAEIGVIDRCANGAKLASYAGLVPRVEISAGHVYYGRITRRGSPWLRWALVEAAMHAPQRDDACGEWVRRLREHKGALKARVAAARRLCDDIVLCWRRCG